jgi:hypothetical protein
MDRGNHDVSKKKTPDHKIQSPRPQLDWKELAEEASKKQDGTKLIELTNRLIDAFENEHAAA